MDKASVLNIYGITDEFAQEWSEESSSVAATAHLDLVNQSTGDGSTHADLSKYALLRQLVSSADGSNAYSSLQNDEADPLGSTPSVLSVLRSRDIDVDTDPSVRGKYLISSTKFSPTTFLRDVHVDATYSNLLHSLDYLESSIAKRSEALRDLVEREYIQFVRSKAMLDSVLQQIDDSGFNTEQGWGVDSIKANIDDANAKATMVMKPVIDYQKKEERLKAALKLIEKNKYLFNLPSTILKHIKNQNHDLLIRDYRKGRDLRNSTVDITSQTPDYIVQNKKIIDRIWDEVEVIVEDYKQDTWKKLSGTSTLQMTDVHSNYMELIGKLLDIGVEDNPISEWIEQQISNLNDQTVDKFEKLKLRTNLMRMNVLGTPPPAEVSFIHPVKELTLVYGAIYNDILTESGSTAGGTAASSVSDNTYHTFPHGICDAMEIVEMWINVRTVIDDISAIAAKVCTFWQNCNGFLVGQKQLTLPTGYQGESETHLRFSNYEISEIKKSGKDLLQLFSDRTMEYFTSPVPQLGSTGLGFSGSGLSIAGGAFNRLSGQFQPNSNTISQSSSTTSLALGQQETFLFLPPYSNALSSSKYLGQVIFSLYSGFRELCLANVQNQASENLRNVLTVVRERSVHSVCKSWQEDCRKFPLVEDWTRAPKNDSLTKLPIYFQTYHFAVLSGIKKIVFYSPENESSELVSQPPSTLLKFILAQFVSAMSISIESIMTSLTTSLEASISGKRLSMSPSSTLTTTASPLSELMDSTVVDELSPKELTPDLKVLLMLSNLIDIRDNVFPRLFRYFERSFLTSSKESSIAVKESTDKMEKNLFELYTRQKRSTLSDAVREGILHSGINWLTTDQPPIISKYIYECLLLLVSVHAKVRSISSHLIKRVITVLFEHLLKTILTYFRQVEKFGKGGALRALTDVRFIRFVMASYETTDSGKTLQLIYSTIKDASIDKTIWTGRDGPLAIVQPFVESATKKSQVCSAPLLFASGGRALPRPVARFARY